MSEASTLLLNGYTLRMDSRVYRDRFEDEDGREMWQRIFAIANRL